MRMPRRLRPFPRFKRYGGFESVRILESLCMDIVPVFYFQLIQRARIQGIHGARLNTNGLLPILLSRQAKIAFLHLGSPFRTKLGHIPGASLETFAIALLVSQTQLSIDDNNAVGVSLGDRVYGTGW